MASAKQLFKVQEIHVGKERAVLVPQDVWRSIVIRLDELADIRAYDEAKADPDQRTVEHDELCRMLGQNPLRYLRVRAGITQAELAKKAGFSQSFIAKVESSEKRLSPPAQRKIARALDIAAEKLQF